MVATVVVSGVVVTVVVGVGVVIAIVVSGAGVVEAVVVSGDGVVGAVTIDEHNIGHVCCMALNLQLTKVKNEQISSSS